MKHLVAEMRVLLSEGTTNGWKSLYAELDPEAAKRAHFWLYNLVQGLSSCFTVDPSSRGGFGRNAVRQGTVGAPTPGVDLFSNIDLETCAESLAAARDRLHDLAPAVAKKAAALLRLDDLEAMVTRLRKAHGNESALYKLERPYIALAQHLRTQALDIISADPSARRP